MRLSKLVGDQIVSKLSKVIEQNINIMDIDGVIISSTDKNRIGSVHSGAVKIINESLKELIINSDDEYAGARQGINIPIEFKNKIIGVIGLTGKSQEVRKYGEIIKKMTEILILDSYLTEQKNTEQMAVERFLDEWTFGKYEINHPREFAFRAATLGIDIKIKRRVMVISIKSNDKKNCEEVLESTLINRIDSLLDKDKQQFFFHTATLYILVLNQLSDDEVIELANKIKMIMTEFQNCSMYIGISSYEAYPISIAFKHAHLALQISKSTKNGIVIYSFANLDIALATIVEKNKTAFLEELFKNVPSYELEEIINLLRVYYDCDGSIKDASEQLFVHKNTMQYRLNKIQEMTGYDPRKFSNSYLLIIAIKLFDLANPK